MRKGMKMPGLLVLLAYACGCSTTHVVTLPGSEGLPDTGIIADQLVAPGDRITLELRDGRQISGRVVDIGVSEVTLAVQMLDFDPVDAEDMPNELATIDRSEIIAAMKKVGDPGKSMLLVLGLLAVSAGIAWMTASPDIGQAFDRMYDAHW